MERTQMDSTPTGNGPASTLNFPKTKDEAIASAAKLVDQATAWAKKNPLPAAAIGLGVGFFLGTIARRMARGK